MTRTGKDRLIIGMLVFFVAFNLTVDLPLVARHRELATGTWTDGIARVWTIYADADRGWIVGPWSLAQEALNVGPTTLANLWLIVAILQAHAYRHALQLALGSCLSYSVVLYYLAAHLSGYAEMRERSLYAFALFYGSSLPWLGAHVYMAGDSVVAITRRFRGRGDRLDKPVPGT